MQPTSYDRSFTAMANQSESPSRSMSYYEMSQTTSAHSQNGMQRSTESYQQVKTFSGGMNAGRSYESQSAFSSQQTRQMQHTGWNANGNERCAPFDQDRMQNGGRQSPTNQSTQNSWSNFISQRTTQHTSGHSNDHTPGGNANAQNNWSSTPVTNGTATLQIGNNTLALDKAKSSMVLTDNKTGQKTTIEGDPHFESNGTSNMFNGPLTLQTSDGTKFTVTPKSDGKVSYANTLQITSPNGQSCVVNGLDQKTSDPLTVQFGHNGRALNAQTPQGLTLADAPGGKGWINTQTGKAPTAADFASH